MKWSNNLVAGLLVLMIIPMASAEMTLLTSGFSFDKTGDNSYQALVAMKNTGTQVEDGILEMAFFPTGTNAFVSGTKTCDPRFPYNVHKYYQAGPGETVNFNLRATSIPDGTYKAVLTHATQCCTDGVNSYSCNDKQPFSWEYTMETVTFGDERANELDECDTDQQAQEWLQQREGVLNCAAPRCSNPASSTSVAVCDSTGECNIGSTQAVSCSNGVTVNVRYCSEDAEWVSTGATCQTAGGGDDPLPPPPGDTGFPLTIAAVAIFVALAALLWLVFKK